ncbi:DUF803-domain-containing protein [Sistotremastrum niveocremeum HHB9708]|uniref:DUF803-domain-containing protein n=1 Tax=Sistotremastrum niveocremeum HHB9708 TaxID=1314777 RepID=A0A164ZEC3_9AGAM|nr:DUF803-domain-containing protein [Sistotremastrum niveocremeum HHB9708]
MSSSSKSFIGITVAICGNILISLALNCQKLAHRRLDDQNKNANAVATQGHENTQPTRDHETTPARDVLVLDTDPLLTRSTSLSYGTQSPTRPPSNGFPPDNSLHSPIQTNGHLVHLPPRTVPLKPASSDQSSPDESPSDDQATSHSGKDDDPDSPEHAQPLSEGAYLRSKLWWFGFALMNVGELGNFLSYAFAPASVVAPLGIFALIANCFFAPLLLHEKFRPRDGIAILLSIVGAVTVVLSARSSDPRLNPEQFLEALSQRTFVIYASVVCAVMLVLGFLSERNKGREWVMIDVGLCALFGGFTVLSTKALSTLISLEWIQIFKEWITYPVVIVLVGTGVGQIKYLNRALMKFDSKQVIPTQFVLFNLSAIVGSAILYGDFNRVTFHQFLTFLYGCGATFAGVFLLTRSSGSTEEEPESTDIERGRSSLAAIPEEDAANANAPARSVPVKILRARASTMTLGLAPVFVASGNAAQRARGRPDTADVIGCGVLAGDTWIAPTKLGPECDAKLWGTLSNFMDK